MDIRTNIKKTILSDNEDLEVIQNWTGWRYGKGIKKDEWYCKYLLRDDILDDVEEHTNKEELKC